MTFGEHWYWGVITLGLVLIPGLYRTATLAMEMKWRDESWVHVGNEHVAVVREAIGHNVGLTYNTSCS